MKYTYRIKARAWLSTYGGSAVLQSPQNVTEALIRGLLKEANELHANNERLKSALEDMVRMEDWSDGDVPEDSTLGRALAALATNKGEQL